jgi:hypothetical protein
MKYCSGSIFTKKGDSSQKRPGSNMNKVFIRPKQLRLKLWI